MKARFVVLLVGFSLLLGAGGALAHPLAPSLLELREQALASGFEEMRVDGIRRVREGATTVSEVQRVNRSHRLSEEERE